MPICAFCGQTVSKATEDHVPPRCLFGSNAGPLIKVPSCKKCNNSTSNDDEYFRLIAAEFNALRNPAAVEALKATMRAMNHPKKVGFRKMVQKSMTQVEVSTPNGLYLGTAPALKIKIERIKRTVAKTVRGLFYHIKQRPLNHDYGVYILDMENAPSFVKTETQEHFVPHLLSQPIISIGEDDAFRYRYRQLDEADHALMLALSFYRRFDFFAFTMPKDDPMDDILAVPKPTAY